MEQLKAELNFLLELDKQKEIIRQTYLASATRKETDAEHSWHLAVMAVLLSKYANEEVDVLKTVKMVLLHDVIEIDAGDTYAYDEKANVSKLDREYKAAERIYGMLPKEQKEEYICLWDEFEKQETAEAKFANTLDKIQPLLLNHASGGKSWKEHKVKKSQVLQRNARTNEGSSLLWEIAQELIQVNVELGNLLDE